MKLKTIWQFIGPTVKAILSVVAFTIGMGWGAYAAVSTIARSEAQTVRKEFLTLDAKNMENINQQFREVKEMIKELNK